MTRFATALSLLSLMSLASASCGGDSPTDPAGTGGGGGGEARTIKANPTFSGDVNEIFQRRGCSSTGCHATNAGGLTLTTSASANYAALVGVAAASESFQLVLPNDAQNSYVVIKTEGRQSVGQRMPLGSSPLDNIDQTNLRNWIDNGATNN